MKLESINDFIIWNTSSRRISYKVVYSDITGSLQAGVLLSQICYWFLPDDGGINRLRVHREGRYWIANRRKDWAKILGMSIRQYDTAVDILKDLDIITLKVFKFKFKDNDTAKPTQHISLNYEVLIQFLNKELSKSAESTINKYIIPKIPDDEKKLAKEQQYKNEIKKILSTKSKEYIKAYNDFLDARVKRSKAGGMTIYARRNMLNALEKFFPNNDREHIRRFITSTEKNYDKVIFPNDKYKYKARMKNPHSVVESRDGIGKHW